MGKLSQWPEMVSEDARDMLHPDRVAVTIPGVTYGDFYLHALNEGYSIVCLSLQVHLMRPALCEGFQEFIHSWLESKKVEEVK